MRFALSHGGLRWTIAGRPPSFPHPVHAVQRGDDATARAPRGAKAAQRWGKCLVPQRLLSANPAQVDLLDLTPLVLSKPTAAFMSGLYAFARCWRCSTIRPRVACVSQTSGGCLAITLQRWYPDAIGLRGAPSSSRPIPVSHTSAARRTFVDCWTAHPHDGPTGYASCAATDPRSDSTVRARRGRKTTVARRRSTPCGCARASAATRASG